MAAAHASSFAQRLPAQAAVPPAMRHLRVRAFRAERSAGATIAAERRFAGETSAAGTTLASRFVTAVTWRTTPTRCGSGRRVN